MQADSLIGLGMGLITISFLGRSSVRFYRSVLRGDAFDRAALVLGQHYQGGFEGAMTKREAGLILGVRESTETDKILKAHRKMMFMNHPDNGGSTYLATKVNEAKDLLL